MQPISLLIPAYNRPRCLQQQIDYYNFEKTDFEIIIGDSSAEENKKQNRGIALKFPGLKIKYLEYPEQTEPYRKFSDMLAQAKGEYSVFCGDDDFLVPGGVEKCADFLEKNKDFSVAHGYYIAFWLKEGRFFWETRYPEESLVSENPKERLFEHLSKYVLPTFYGVHRTQPFKEAYKELLDSKADTVIFGEMVPSLISVICGKTKTLEVMYMARQVGPRQDHRPTPIEYMKQGRYEKEYAKFRNCLARKLSEKTGEEFGSSQKIIDRATAIYLKREYGRGPKRILRDLAGKNAYFGKFYKKAGMFFKKASGGNIDPCYNFKSEYEEDLEKIKKQAIRYSKI